MLNEGRRRHERGTDVVVGFVETHGRREDRRADRRPRGRPAQAGRVPRARRSRRWTSTPSSPAGPQVALVDELAHTNVPGSRNEKRWQDVEELLDAGIDVISTVNIQHLESLNDVVERITGVKQRETIPDEVVRRADQVELVDMTPEALRRRQAHGNIYPPEKVDAALAQLLPAGQPRRAARARAAVGRRPGRRGLAGVPRAPRHRRSRGRRGSGCVVALTGAPGGERLDPPGGADGAARRTASCSASTSVPQDGLAAPTADAARAAARSCSRSSAAPTTRSSATTSAQALARLRPRRRTRPRSCSARAGGRAGSELTRGSVITTGDPRTRGRHRRPRDQPSRGDDEDERPSLPRTSSAGALAAAPAGRSGSCSRVLGLPAR